MTSLRLFTSESVTEGHPDKVCDRIADSILDALLEQDPHARAAIEVFATTGQVHVMGEVTTDRAYVEIPQIVREEICRLGYTSSRIGFDGASCGVSVSIGQQSPDIAGGVERSLEAREGADTADPRELQGAGDQGLMFGYASDETPDLMPAPIWTAHKLSHRLAQVRHDGTIDGLRPDGKTQVTFGYDENHTPVSIETIVVSTQHDEALTLADLTRQVRRHVIEPVLDESGLNVSWKDAEILVNPSGRFVYGAFSGKDPSKVDRSASYTLRWIAKHIVATGIAKRCEVQVAYAIGRAHPVGLYVDTFDTGQVDDATIARAITDVFDLRPAGMIEDLALLRPIYKETSAYGHFGRPGFPWEDVTRIEDLRAALKG